MLKRGRGNLQYQPTARDVIMFHCGLALAFWGLLIVVCFLHHCDLTVRWKPREKNVQKTSNPLWQYLFLSLLACLSVPQSNCSRSSLPVGLAYRHPPCLPKDSAWCDQVVPLTAVISQNEQSSSCESAYQCLLLLMYISSSLYTLLTTVSSQCTVLQQGHEG